MNERGAALLLAILLVLALAAVAAAAAATARIETLIAGSFQQGMEALYVADGALAIVVHDLAERADWTAALAGAARPREPGFRHFFTGSARDWGPVQVISDVGVEVWISDDPADTDGDRLADSNGVLLVHAEARGPTRARRSIRAVVARDRDPAGAILPGTARVRTWREWTW